MQFGIIAEKVVSCLYIMGVWTTMAMESLPLSLKHMLRSLAFLASPMQLELSESVGDGPQGPAAYGGSGGIVHMIPDCIRA